jgi:hypothetical protein
VGKTSLLYRLEVTAEQHRLLQASNQRCLVMVDELPIFVLNLLRAHGRERVRLFLNWFRHVRIDRQARLAVRWLLAYHHEGYFDPWYQRLRDELGAADENHALAVLEAVAKDPSGVASGVLHELSSSRGASHEFTRYILAVLVNDGYLVTVDERWCFRSPLLRDYWRSMVLA